MVFCTYCGQSFTRAEHLERHILTHTNIKPFKCFTCNMFFSRRDLLQRHYTVHQQGRRTPDPDPVVSGIADGSVLSGSSRCPLPLKTPQLETNTSRPKPHGHGVIQSGDAASPPWTDLRERKAPTPLKGAWNAAHEGLEAHRHTYANIGASEQAASLSLNERQVFEIPSFVAEKHLTYALGDYCAKFNFMRENYALQLDLTIDYEKSSEVSIGTRKKITTLGTVAASFRFQDEEEKFTLVFHILPKCFHEVILGRSFLKATDTFSSLTKLARRVKVRIIEEFGSRRLLYMGDSAPRFQGRLNDIPQHGLADSGAKVLIMDEDYAESIGLPILSSQKHCTKLTFADESTAYTSGITCGVSWKFGFDLDEMAKHYKLDFHILKNAPANVILSDCFLFGTEAYSRHNRFLVEDDDDVDDDAFLFAIDVARDYIAEAQVDMASSRNMMYKEDLLRDSEEDRIMNLPTREAQEAEREKVNQRRAQWMEKFLNLHLAEMEQQSSGSIPPLDSSRTPIPHGDISASTMVTKPNLSLLKRSSWRLKFKRKNSL